MTPYHRTAAQMGNDFNAAAIFEQEVLRHLPPWTVDRSKSSTELDFWIPGSVVEVKEKRQVLSSRWHIEGIPHEDLFVLDELSLRKGMRHFPGCYYVLRDVPLDRLFLASITELAVIERERLMRVGKGKLLINLGHFRQLTSLDEVVPAIMTDLGAMPWKLSESLGQLTPRQV